MILLDNRMFQDDTLECQNFFLCSEMETYQVEIDSQYLKSVMDQIETAYKAGKSYIDVSELNITYIGSQWDDKILEIQWG